MSPDNRANNIVHTYMCKLTGINVITWLVIRVLTSNFTYHKKYEISTYTRSSVLYMFAMMYDFKLEICM